jgi:hypothetical protein
MSEHNKSERTRDFHYLHLLAHTLDNSEPLERAIGQLERSYIRTLNSLESRRRQHPQLGKPDKIMTPKTEETNPPTPTKQTPKSRQVRRRREREERRLARNKGTGDPG